MKVKAASKSVNPMDRLDHDLIKLGFIGGEETEGSVSRNKRVYGYGSRKRAPLTEKIGGGAESLSSEPFITLTIKVNLKDGTLVWNYDSAAMEKVAMGFSAVHSKLTMLFGHGPGSVI